MSTTQTALVILSSALRTELLILASWAELSYYHLKSFIFWLGHLKFGARPSLAKVSGSREHVWVVHVGHSGKHTLACRLRACQEGSLNRKWIRMKGMATGEQLEGRMETAGLPILLFPSTFLLSARPSVSPAPTVGKILREPNSSSHQSSLSFLA